MSLPYERLELLLSVVEKAAGHGGRLAAILKEAQTELNAINDGLIAEAKAAAAEAKKPPAAVVAELPSATDESTTPRQSETDKIALDNMRRL